MAENSVSNKGGMFKMNLDVSEALTGLKAVQREAKETVKALKEIENFNSRELANYSTKELHEELATREGVYELNFNLGDKLELSTNVKGTLPYKFTGPVRFLINED